MFGGSPPEVWCLCHPVICTIKWERLRECVHVLLLWYFLVCLEASLQVSHCPSSKVSEAPGATRQRRALKLCRLHLIGSCHRSHPSSLDLQGAVTADWFLWLILLIFSDTFQIYTSFSPTLPHRCLITVLTEYFTPPLSNQSEWNMSENDDSVAICRALWGPLQMWQPGWRADPGNE